MFQYLTDTSSEIEVLFIERTLDLLNVGGIAGIILPSSILSNPGIYTKARELILENFLIKAIVELGSNTFMATGTNTIILFMQKRDSRYQKDYRYVAEDYLINNTFRKDDFEDTLILFQAYVSHLNLEFTDYQSLVNL